MCTSAIACTAARNSRTCGLSLVHNPICSNLLFNTTSAQVTCSRKRALLSIIRSCSICLGSINKLDLGRPLCYLKSSLSGLLSSLRAFHKPASNSWGTCMYRQDCRCHDQCGAVYRQQLSSMQGSPLQNALSSGGCGPDRALEAISAHPECAAAPELCPSAAKLAHQYSPISTSKQTAAFVTIRPEGLHNVIELICSSSLMTSSLRGRSIERRRPDPICLCLRDLEPLMDVPVSQRLLARKPRSFFCSEKSTC